MLSKEMEGQLFQKHAIGVQGIAETQAGLKASFAAAEQNLTWYKENKIIKSAVAIREQTWDELKKMVKEVHGGVRYEEHFDWDTLIDQATYGFEAYFNDIDTSWINVLTDVKHDSQLRLISLGVSVEDQIETNIAMVDTFLFYQEAKLIKQVKDIAQKMAEYFEEERVKIEVALDEKGADFYNDSELQYDELVESKFNEYKLEMKEEFEGKLDVLLQEVWDALNNFKLRYDEKAKKFRSTVWEHENFVKSGFIEIVQDFVEQIDNHLGACDV